MKNNFLRKGLITGAVLTGWLVFTSLSGNALAADKPIGDGLTVVADDTTGTDDYSTVGGTTGFIELDNAASVATSLDVVSGDTITIQDSATTANNTMTFSGAVTLNGTGALTVSDDAGLVTADTLVLDASESTSVVTVGSDGLTLATGTTVGDGHTLSLNTAGDVALSAVTGGNAGALTTSGAGDVSATSLELDDGVFTATNGGTGTLALGNITTTSATGALTTATGAVTAGNMTIDNDTTLTAGAAFTAGGTTAIADSTTLTVAATGDVALGDVTGGNAGALTTSGAGAVSATSLELDDAVFTATNGGTGTLALGNITTTSATGALTTATGAVTAGDMTISNDTTLTAGAAFTAGGTTAIADSTTLTVAATGDVALGDVTGGNAGALTTSGAGAVSATSLQLDDAVFTATNGGTGTLALGNITTTSATGALTTATGAVTAGNMTIDNDTTLTAGAAFTAGGTTAIADSTTLTVAATGDVALGAVTGGNAGALTTSGDGAVSATSLELDDGEFTATNGGTSTLALGEITTTNDAGVLTTDTGAIGALNLDIDNNTTINVGSGAALTLSGTCPDATDIATGKTLTIAAADVATINGTTIHNNGSLVTTGAANVVGTALTVGANDSASIDVSGATGVLSYDSSTFGAGSTITITTPNDPAVANSKLDLGNVTFEGGVTGIAQMDGNGEDLVLSVNSFSNTGDVSILKMGGTYNNTNTASAYVNQNATIYLEKDVIYDGFAMAYESGDDLVVTGPGKFINAGTPAGGNIAAETAVTSSEAYGSVTAGASETVSVSNGATLVATGNTSTTDATGTIAIGSGSNYTQFGGNFDVEGNTALEGELLLANSAGTNVIDTLTVAGSDAKIRGVGSVTVNGAAITGTVKLENDVTLGAGIGDMGTGAVELGNTTSAGSTLTLGDDASIGTLAVTSGETATVTGAQTLTAANGANINGHLNLAGGADLDVTAGALTISNNTLAMADGSTVTVNDAAWIAETGVGGDSHIEVDSSAAGATATIDNHSDNSSNVLGLLTIATDATTNTNAATMVIDNTSVAAGESAWLKIKKVDLTDANAAATLTIQNPDATNSNAVEIVELNITDAAAGATVNLNDDAKLTVNTVNFKGGTDGAIVAAGTSDLTIINVNVDATLAADVTGSITSGGGSITGTTTITGLYDSVSPANRVATLTLADAANITGTVVLAGETDVAQAVLDDSAVGSAISTLTVNSGKFGTLTNHADTRVSTMNVNGALAITNTYTVGANRVNIGSTGVLGVLGGANNLDVTGSTVAIDLGTGNQAEVTAATANFGTVDVAGTITYAPATDTIVGANGVAGTTYTDVIEVAVTNLTALDGTVLSSENAYRTYTLRSGTVAADDLSIEVAANTSGIRNAVTGNGGTSTAATAANYLVANEGSFDAAGRSYVQAMTNLAAPEFARAAEQTIGEEGTTATAQAGVMSVQNSAKSVSNQMTSFRSGNIGAAMTSSFNSGGATSALSNMADADTLADAYEAGFTSASDCGVYKKVQVWANGFGGFGEQGSDGNMIGYDFWNIGTMVGLDYAFAKELRVGALLGYSYNKTDGYWGSGDSSDNAIRFGAYASYNWDNFFVDMSPTMGVHMIDSNRNIWNGATAKGERTGVDFNMNGTIGYTFNLPAAIQITPTYSLSYTMFYDPDYTETGAGAANLAVDSFTSNSLIQDLGVKVGKLFRSSDKLAFLPEVWGGWEVEYLNTGGSRNSTTSSSIGGQAYSTTMNGMSTHRGYWGAGMTALIGDDVSVYGRYDHKIWDKGYNVGFSAGVKVSF